MMCEELGEWDEYDQNMLQEILKEWIKHSFCGGEGTLEVGAVYKC